MGETEEKKLLFKNAAQWRCWLEKYHAIAAEAWLIHYKKKSSETAISYEEALQEALCYGWIDGRLKSIDGEKYSLRYSPRRPRSIWSQANTKRAEKLIAEGRMTGAGMKKIEEAKKNGLWDEAYSGRDDIVVLDELLEALEKDAVAVRNFEGFARSYRIIYAGWVAGAKTAETRRRRIETVVQRSRRNIKPGIMI